MNAANARILIIDGNVAAVRARQVSALGYDSGNGYARVLRRLEPALRIDIVTAADGEVRFRNPAHPAARAAGLAPAVLSSV